MINSEIHNVNTRHSCNLHLHSPNLDIYQKGVRCLGIKIFNIFPFNIKKCCNYVRTYKSALKCFLHVNCCYSLANILKITIVNKYDDDDDMM